MAYALIVVYLPNFSLPIAFTCMVHQSFPHQIFPMYGISVLDLKKFEHKIFEVKQKNLEILENWIPGYTVLL